MTTNEHPDASAELVALVASARTAREALEAAETRAIESATDADTSRDVARRQAAELGRILSTARRRWPRRGPLARGWGEFLREVGVEARAARRYIAFACKVSASSANDADTPIESRRGKPAADRLSSLLERTGLDPLP